MEDTRLKRGFTVESDHRPVFYKRRLHLKGKCSLHEPKRFSCDRLRSVNIRESYRDTVSNEMLLSNNFVAQTDDFQAVMEESNFLGFELNEVNVRSDINQG